MSASDASSSTKLSRFIISSIIIYYTKLFSFFNSCQVFGFKIPEKMKHTEPGILQSLPACPFDPIAVLHQNQDYSQYSLPVIGWSSSSDDMSPSSPSTSSSSLPDANGDLASVALLPYTSSSSSAMSAAANRLACRRRCAEPYAKLKSQFSSQTKLFFYKSKRLLS